MREERILFITSLTDCNILRGELLKHIIEVEQIHNFTAPQYRSSIIIIGNREWDGWKNAIYALESARYKKNKGKM